MGVNNYREIFYNYLCPRSWCENDQEFILWDLITAVSTSGGQNTYDIIYNLNRIIDIDQTPAKFLPWLASFVNFPLNYFAELFSWDLTKQRTIIKWLYSNQRYTGTKKGIKDFVETFIEGSLVQEIKEPWKDVFILSISDLSGKDRIQNSSYYRDSVLHIYVTNSHENVRYLLEWLIDPHIKYYITSTSMSQSDNLVDTEIYGDLYIYKWGEANTGDVFYLSDTNSRISDCGLICGRAMVFYSNYTQIVYGDIEKFYPLVGTIWQIKEIVKNTKIIYDPLLISDSGFSTGEVLTGAELTRSETPLVGEDWVHFGDIDFQEA